MKSTLPGIMRNIEEISKFDMNGPTQPAHQMKAHDEENSNIRKNGRNWQELAQNGPEWPEKAKIQFYKSHTKLHIKLKLATRRIRISKK